MTKKIILFFFTLSLVFFYSSLLFSGGSIVLAEGGAGGTEQNGGAASGSETPPAANNNVNLINPLGGTTGNPAGTINSVPQLIGNIINAALGIVGSLALVMFIYGGFTWMLAAGNEQAVEKGKNILMWAAIGLVVIFASYSLVSFVISAITKGGT
ncbi:MAG: pilin [Patescibacteria group bacterium]|nr:pilin [Patescibacteria group bacterium]